MAGFRFELLYKDDDMVAIHKPSGFHVHQPEFPRRRVSREITCLPLLRNQLRQRLFPVHRLDVATSGVLLFALNKECASWLCREFSGGGMLKKYYAIVRGFTLDQGEITAPLASDSSGDMLESHTVYKTLARIELPYAVGKRHPTARYSFVEVQPLTGRFHQIRRHLARIGHPVLGDCTHGDSYHNRFFRETLEIPGLMLRSALLDFQDARNGERFAIKSSIWSEPWQNAFKRFAWSQP